MNRPCDVTAALCWWFDFCQCSRPIGSWCCHVSSSFHVSHFPQSGTKQITSLSSVPFYNHVIGGMWLLPLLCNCALLSELLFVCQAVFCSQKSLCHQSCVYAWNAFNWQSAFSCVNLVEYMILTGLNWGFCQSLSSKERNSLIVSEVEEIHAARCIYSVGKSATTLKWVQYCIRAWQNKGKLC